MWEAKMPDWLEGVQTGSCGCCWVDHAAVKHLSQLTSVSAVQHVVYGSSNMRTAAAFCIFWRSLIVLLVDLLVGSNSSLYLKTESGLYDGVEGKSSHTALISVMFNCRFSMCADNQSGSGSLLRFLWLHVGDALCFFSAHAHYSVSLLINRKQTRNLKLGTSCARGFFPEKLSDWQNCKCLSFQEPKYVKVKRRTMFYYLNTLITLYVLLH